MSTDDFAPALDDGLEPYRGLNAAMGRAVAPDAGTDVEALADVREAVLGEIIQDIGQAEDDPAFGFFIVGVDGYFDVDNSLWCEPDPDDVPWTSEHFHLLGTVKDLLGTVKDLLAARDAALVAAAEARGAAEERGRIARAILNECSHFDRYRGRPDDFCGYCEDAARIARTAPATDRTEAGGER